MTRVLLFAQAREAAGTRAVDLDGATIAEVLAAAAERFGAEFARVALGCTIVVDDEIVPRSEHATHSAGRELAVLPPVSGGATEDGLHQHHHGDHAQHGGAAEGAPLRVAVLTVSDRASRGEYEDLTGPAIEQLVADRLGAQIVERAVVPDDREQIEGSLRALCDGGTVDLVLTNGGTGLSPRDVTPEATRAVLDVEAPGIGELMRAAGLAHTPLASLARQSAGRRGRTIVVNLPGSVKGATESLDAVIGVLAHACATAAGGVRP
jgi:molybdenum cofactor synthesis domain-containing protein